jgi:ABC-type multidrug transport system ATPase subunit
VLVCNDLSFAYQGRMRLTKVSFSAPRGQIVALFGHNGSGKSTLLKMLGGSLPVRCGDVSWMSQSALAKNGYLRSDLRKDVGVLFQNCSSDEKLTLIDNLVFSARLYGLSRAQALEKAHEVLFLASLTDRAKDSVKTLSPGLRRRLELYRCFMHEPQLVLLDEPTAGLDVAEIKKFMGFINQYKAARRAAIVIASHHPDELLLADLVVMMKEGKVIEQGAPSAMLKRLDYLRCSFLLDNANDAILDGLQLFQCERNLDGSINAKFSLGYLDAFLKSPFVRHASFRSLSIDKPSLADVYRDLAQEMNNA